MSRERAWSPANAAPGTPRVTTPIAGGQVHGGHYEPPSYVIRQQAFDQPGYAPGARPLDAASPPPPRRRVSTGGCIMGTVAVGLICVLAAVLVALFVGQPYLEDAVDDRLRQAVSTEVIRELEAEATRDPDSGNLAPGTYVLRADEINAELAADPDQWEPLDSPTVTIEPDGFEIRFEIFGLESGYHGLIEAERGRLVLTDVEADGAAAQVLSTGDLREIVEDELNTYFANNDLTVTDVELGDGELTVVTAEAGAPQTGGARPTRTPAAAADEDEDEDEEVPDLLPTSTRSPRPTPDPGNLFGPRRTPTPDD